MKAHSTIIWAMERTNRRLLTRNEAQVYSEEILSTTQKKKMREEILGSIILQLIQKILHAIQNDKTTQITLHQGQRKQGHQQNHQAAASKSLLKVECLNFT